MSTLRLKDKEYYNSNKKTFNTKYNKIWKQIAGRPFLGSCSYLFRKYKPTSYQDFFDKYVNDSDTYGYDSITCRGSEHHGRSIEQLNRLAELYHKRCNDKDITVDMCFDDIVNHAIIETYDGHQAELIVMKAIDSTGKYYTEPCEDDIDARYGVDIIVKNKENGKISNLLQIKPITTFLGTYNSSLIEDRKNFFNKQNELNDYMYNIGRGDEIRNIEFMCYDKQHYDRTKEILFLTENGRMRFNLSELCDLNGMPRKTYKNCIFKQIDLQ